MPITKPRWAELHDASTSPLAPSLSMIDGIHQRWATLLPALTDADFARGYTHPENGRQPLEQVVALYAWHSKHHTAHITELRKRMGW